MASVCCGVQPAYRWRNGLLYAFHALAVKGGSSWEERAGVTFFSLSLLRRIAAAKRVLFFLWRLHAVSAFMHLCSCLEGMACMRNMLCLLSHILPCVIPCGLRRRCGESWRCFWRGRLPATFNMPAACLYAPYSTAGAWRGLPAFAHRWLRGFGRVSRSPDLQATAPSPCLRASEHGYSLLSS